MTDREKAIIMAYTGITMLTGDKFSIFHKYIEDILGRSVWTHELADHNVWNEIKEKSENDFLKLCEDEPDDRWIPVSERLPKTPVNVLVQLSTDYITTGHCVNKSIWTVNDRPKGAETVTHWRPLPKPCKESEAKSETDNLPSCNSCIHNGTWDCIKCSCFDRYERRDDK